MNNGRCGMLVIVLLLTSLLVSACGSTNAGTAPERVAEQVARALMQEDLVTLDDLVADAMPMRDLTIPDELRQWQNVQATAGACAQPTARDTRMQGQSLVVRVVADCAERPVGMDLTMVEGDAGYQVLDMRLLHSSEIADEADVQSTPDAGARAATRNATTPAAANTPLAQATASSTPAPALDQVQATIAAAVAATSAALEDAASPTPAPTAPDTDGAVPFGDPVILVPAAITGSTFAPPGQDAAGQVIGYAPANVGDGNPETAWRVPGDGVGEQVVFTFAEPVTVAAVAIINGYAKTDDEDGVDRYTQNRRVTEVTIIWDGGEITAALNDRQRGPQQVRLPSPVQTSRLVVEIAATTADGGRDFAAISEITVLGQ